MFARLVAKRRIGCTVSFSDAGVSFMSRVSSSINRNDEAKRWGVSPETLRQQKLLRELTRMNG
jgi:hypothetical protein